MIIRAHTFQYVWFVINNIPIVEFVWLCVNRQSWDIVDLRWNTKKFIHFGQISKAFRKRYLHISTYWFKSHTRRIKSQNENYINISEILIFAQSEAWMNFVVTTREIWYTAKRFFSLASANCQNTNRYTQMIASFDNARRRRVATTRTVYKIQRDLCTMTIYWGVFLSLSPVCCQCMDFDLRTVKVFVFILLIANIQLSQPFKLDCLCYFFGGKMLQTITKSGFNLATKTNFGEFTWKERKKLIRVITNWLFYFQCVRWVEQHTKHWQWHSHHHS